MDEDLIAIRESARNEKIKNFYEKNKSKIYSILSVLIIILISIVIYFEVDKRKTKKISSQYMEASIYFNEGNKDKAKKIFKEIVLSNEKTYSVLSLFFIIDNNLIENNQETLELFNHLIENSKFDIEVKNLLIYKKALSAADLVNENEILIILNPIISSNSIWKPHALLLLADFFFNKSDFSKAEEFYDQILLIPNVEQSIYDQAIFQKKLISNE